MLDRLRQKITSLRSSPIELQTRDVDNFISLSALYVGSGSIPDLARKSPTVQSIVRWLGGAVPEGRITLQRDDEEIEGPSEFLRGLQAVSPDVWHLTIRDYAESGNALWVKEPGIVSIVGGYRYVPWSEVSFYNGIYYVGQSRARYLPDQVVHFRALSQTGVSLSPLDSFSGILRADKIIWQWIPNDIQFRPNIGMFVSPSPPREGEPLTVDMGDVVNRINTVQNAKAVGADDSIVVQQLKYDSSQTDLSATLYEIQAALCAEFGVAPAVIPLGVGLARATYSNYETARRVSFENGVLPMQNIIAATLIEQALPDFYAPGEGYKVVYDNSHIPALMENQDALSMRTRDEYRDGLISLEEARITLGRTPQVEGLETEERSSVVQMRRQDAERERLVRQLEDFYTIFGETDQAGAARELAGPTADCTPDYRAGRGLTDGVGSTRHTHYGYARSGVCHCPIGIPWLPKPRRWGSQRTGVAPSGQV